MTNCKQLPVVFILFNILPSPIFISCSMQYLKLIPCHLVQQICRFCFHLFSVLCVALSLLGKDKNRMERNPANTRDARATQMFPKNYFTERELWISGLAWCTIHYFSVEKAWLMIFHSWSLPVHRLIISGSYWK